MSRDEILIKGADGKWYILKGEELLAYDEKAKSKEQRAKSSMPSALGPTPMELPKGVGQEAHERLEQTPVPERSSVRGAADDRKQKTEVAAQVRPPSSVLRPPDSHAEHPLFKELEELIDGVIQNVKLKMQNAEWMSDTMLQKRFRTIVSARLREVRDMLETSEMLVRAQKVGGLGLGMGQLQEVTGGYKRLQEVTEADRVLEIIERAFGEFQQKWKAVEDQRREARKRLQQEQQEREREQKEMEAKPPVTKPQIAQLPKPLPGGSVVKEKAVVPPPAQPYPLVPSRPKKLTDVRQAPQLIGPLEELASLTMVDFRRLASTPAEAVAKIFGKLEFLGQESIVRRAQGIAAWRKSPLNDLYVQISHQALSGRSAPEAVLAQATAEGQPTLTLPEFRAIMELNQKLRF